MIRFNYVLIVGAIALLTLVGCSSPNQTTTQTPAGSPASNTGAARVTSSQAGYQSLLGVVSNTRAAVEAGNYTQAKAEFTKFEDNWKQVEDGIKAKSGDSYKAIEDSLDRVTGQLRGAQPNKQQVLTDLQSLEKNINGVAKL